VRIGTAISELRRNFDSPDIVQLGSSKWMDVSSAFPRETWLRIVAGKTGHGNAASVYGGLLEVAGRAWERGAPIDWQAIAEEEGGRKIELPTYPFNRRRIPYIEAALGDQEGNVRRAVTDPMDSKKDEFNSPTSRIDAATTPATEHATSPPVNRNATEKGFIGLQGTDEDSTPLRAIDALVDLCKEVLKVSAVNRAQTFLECGGDSIRAAQFVWAVEKRFGIRLEIDDVLEKSLSDLADLLEPTSVESPPLGGMTLTALCGMCEEALKIAAASGTQTFLDCGGDSIRAIQFIWMVEKKFHIKLDVEDVLTLSLNDLALVIDRQGVLSTQVATVTSSQMH
jgi:acyl carrier protein